MNCPCGNSADFNACCGPYLKHQSIPQTPTQLMRSRYTAYTLGDIAYIKETMRPPAANGFDEAAIRQWQKDIRWQKLEVINNTTDLGEGWVEFKAFYKTKAGTHCMHEKSHFKKENNQWYYVDGQSYENSLPKVGRNEPCPCGSQLKYKKCCYNLKD